MEILIIYSAPEQNFIHEEKGFEGIDQAAAARRFAQEKRGVLIIKVAGDPLQVESFVSDSPATHRHQPR